MDIIACILEIAGAWLVGNRNRIGFLILMVSSILWFLAGGDNKMLGLRIVSVVFFGINIRNYIKWRERKE